jgi:hypothetical protein
LKMLKYFCGCIIFLLSYSQMVLGANTQEKEKLYIYR